jgi:hypothetical protein
MQRHGEAMTLLLASVVFLEFADAEFLARQIAEDPKIDRPDPDDTDSFNAALPRSFFDYQDALYEGVIRVAAAARSHDDKKLTEAFGALTHRCVACHAAFLHDREATQSSDEMLGVSMLSKGP